MSQQQYIGNRISLISKLDIRYEGILACVDSQEATIALAKVRSFGTEDRITAHSVPPQDKTYEYIIFKASDIKDLIVCEQQNTGDITYDPAILSVTQQAPESQAIKQPENNEVETKTTTSEQHSKPQQQKSLPKPNEQQQSYVDRVNRSSQQRPTESNDQLQSQQRQPFNNRENPASFQQNRPYNNENVFSGNRNNQFNNRQNGAPGYRQPNQTANYRGNNGYNNNGNYQRGSSYGGNRNMSYNRNHFSQHHQRDNRLKFDSDFDFEKANEKFQEQLTNVEKLLAGAKIEKIRQGDSQSLESGNLSPIGSAETFYNKSTSFFDNISCEAIEKEEGTNTRPDWKKERQTNQETFGHSAVRSLTFRRGARPLFPTGRPQNNQPRNNYNNVSGNPSGALRPGFQGQQRQNNFTTSNRRNQNYNQ